MNPVQVEVILANRTKPLTLVPLFALQPDREPYHVMLLQPHGFVEVNENRIGHADAARGYNTCRTFLDAASAKHADLVVTPEYCTPWKVVGDIVSGEIRPDEGAIWALGCESITPAELRELGTRIANAGDGIFLYHEPTNQRQEAQKQYIDPLLYVFWAKDQQAASVLCLLVQFKTAPCKDERDIEQTALYLGQDVYVFNRGPSKIRLLGLICSDAFVFTNELIEEYHPNSLILHIQLNPKPAHSDYAAYRARLCSVGSSNNVELLCLNWAQNVRELKSDGTHKNWENIAGSGWYIPPTKFRSDDTVIDEAHRKGIYYCVVSKKWHVFYLNYTEQVLLLRKQKLLITGPQALLPATCLSVAERWGWNDVE